MVHFVGAGPGAKDLITVRGFRYIQEADVIIYAGSLVNPALLEDAREGCEIHNSATMTLQQVIEVMALAEEEGKTTVRLHTGDPSIYGAIREQMDALDDLGIDYDVCPGVSALFGAAASLHCEYTLPELSQTVIISRAEGRTAVPKRERLRSLAAHHATLVLYLSSGLAGKVRDELIEGGYEPETCVAVVYKATWPEERLYRTTLGELPDMMEREHVTKTALIIVGDVVATTQHTNSSHGGEGYAKSKLYDPTFATEYRAATAMAWPENISSVLLIACSENAYRTAKKLMDKIETFAPQVSVSLQVKCSAVTDLPEKYRMESSVRQCVERNFDRMDAMIFVSASGIAVRSIAPLLTHKSVDPAILCMDELGKYVISLVSGHAGGANALAGVVAGQIGATEVITTATDVEGRFSVDDFARQNNLVVTDWEMAKKISTQVLAGKRIGISTEYEDLKSYPVEGCSVLISNGSYGELPDTCLQLVPRNLVLGIGCKRDTPKEGIEKAVAEALSRAGYREEAVAAVGSIDLKKAEKGLTQFCGVRDIPFSTFTAEELMQVSGAFTGSDFVKEITGVDCVCERSAVALAQMMQEKEKPRKLSSDVSRGLEDKEEYLVAEKYVKDGVTVAIARFDVWLNLREYTGQDVYLVGAEQWNEG